MLGPDGEQRPDLSTEEMEAHIAAFYDSSSAGLKLMALYAYFVRTFRDVTLEDLDASYGIPSARMMAHFQTHAKLIQQLPDYAAFYEFVGHPIPASAKELHADLCASIQRSLKYGYHGRCEVCQRPTGTGGFRFCARHKCPAPECPRQLPNRGRWACFCPSHAAENEKSTKYKLLVLVPPAWIARSSA